MFRQFPSSLLSPEPLSLSVSLLCHGDTWPQGEDRGPVSSESQHLGSGPGKAAGKTLWL